MNQDIGWGKFECSKRNSGIDDFDFWIKSYNNIIMFNASRGNLLTYCETFDTFFMGKFYNSLSKVKLENLKFVNRFKPVERVSEL